MTVMLFQPMMNNVMRFDYYYGAEADTFAFYRIPKVLFTEECFKKMSTDAKALYGILLDRMNLSARNRWLDENGRVYIIFTIRQIMDAVGCAEHKAVKLLNELEAAGLILRRKWGQGKPNTIYVVNIISGLRKEQSLNCYSDNPEIVVSTTQELPKAQCSNTDKSNTEYSNTNHIHSFQKNGMEARDERSGYLAYFTEKLELNYLRHDYPFEQEILNEILNLIVDTVCTRRKTIRIAGDDKPAGIVRSQFMRMDSGHIRLVMDGMKENTTEIRNIKQYLLAALYNSTLTISSYYSARVNSDMAKGKI